MITTDEKIKDENRLLLIQKEISKLDYWKNFDARRKFEEPLDEWSEKKLREAVIKVLKTESFDNIFKWIYRADCKMADNITEFSMKECETLNQAVCKFYEDDEIIVSMWLDYDCDTTLCKYAIESKLTTLSYSSAIDLGTKYLSHAIQIEIA